MQRINAYIAYLIGVNLNATALQIREQKATYARMLLPTTEASQTLETFIGDSRISLHGSKFRAQIVVDLLRQIKDASATQPNDIIPEAFRHTLWNELVAFQNVFQTECNQLPLFLVQARRGWDPIVLSEFAEFVLPGLTWSSLSAAEKRDIQAAGRCLAFEVPTAAVFHLYRFLESRVLKYTVLFGATLKDSDRNLGNYIKILESNGVDTRITTMLTHIKNEYRNPAIHPGVFFDGDAASVQMALVVSVAHLMSNDLLRRLGVDFVWPNGDMAGHFKSLDEAGT
jgi:hypothetical protein